MADSDWVSGVSYGILTALLIGGATDVLDERTFDAEQWLATLEREAVTVGYTVPTASQAGLANWSAKWEYGMSEYRDEVDKAISEALQQVAPEAEAVSLEANTNLRDQVEMDSVGFLNFITALERRLDLDIPEVDYPRLSSLAGCRRYLIDG